MNSICLLDNLCLLTCLGLLLYWFVYIHLFSLCWHGMSFNPAFLLSAFLNSEYFIWMPCKLNIVEISFFKIQFDNLQVLTKAFNLLNIITDIFGFKSAILFCAFNFSYLIYVLFLACFVLFSFCFWLHIVFHFFLSFKVLYFFYPFSFQPKDYNRHLWFIKVSWCFYFFPR